MDVISISKRKYEGLQKIDLSDINTEGVIYKFPYLGKQKLLKKLYIEEGIALASKMFTIEMLNSNQDILPKYFVIPESLVTVEKKVVGFSLPYINGITLKTILNNNTFSLEDQIKYLKEVGNILNKMAKIRESTELRHFYLNDLHESNLMLDYNTGKLCIIDLDSCKISSSFCFPSRYLTKNALLNSVSKYKIDDYKHGSYVMANKDSDLYCYIIMILNYLFGDNINSISLNTFYDYLNYLEFVGIDENLLGCFRRIVSYGENINPSEYLNKLNSEQVCRAKKLVYENVRKNRSF